MNKPKDKIEELFQSHSDDFDKMPDDKLWETIEAQLPPIAPKHIFLRWSLAAALLLFSLIGYWVYQSFTRPDKPVMGQSGKVPVKTAEKYATINSREDAEKTAEKTKGNTNKNQTAGEAYQATVVMLHDKKEDKSKILAERQPKKSANSQQMTKDTAAPKLFAENKEQAVAAEVYSPKTASVSERENDLTNAVQLTEIPVIQQADGPDNRLAEVNYLATKDRYHTNGIPFNTHIAYEPVYHPEPEPFFKTPAEWYVSLTPSLSYYRVFSNVLINQFSGASNGGRIGWAIQAGGVYPLKIRRLNYRVGVSYFSAQSNFKYSVVKGKQEPIRLNNNTFAYGAIESMETDSKKWQVFELQNDLLFDINHKQQAVIGVKAGSDFSKKPVFDTYLGYRFSKPVNARQVIWLEMAYAYAINAQNSSNRAFSYHMDKYSLRVGLNFR